MKFCTMMFSALSFALILSACSINPIGTKHDAECNELKSRLIFNGATGDSRRSQIQRAETPLVREDFDHQCVAK